MRSCSQASLSASSFVLVATNNSATRIDIARLVARLGMTTLATFDGAATLAAVRAYDSDICAAILDDNLLTLRGSQVAQELQHTAANLPLIMLDPTGSTPITEDCLALTSGEHGRISAFLRDVLERATTN